MLNFPYNTLKQDKRAYGIMLLRDQHAGTFAEIAKVYKITAERTAQIYYKIKFKQIRLYIDHISATLGYEDNSQIKKVYESAYDCYRDWFYACAYLEKKYKVLLDEYRGGEPGMPIGFVRNLPPFRPKLSKKTVARVVDMREVEKAAYIAIAKKLHMTPAKARHTYEWFYCRS